MPSTRPTSGGLLIVFPCRSWWCTHKTGSSIPFFSSTPTKMESIPYNIKLFFLDKSFKCPNLKKKPNYNEYLKILKKGKITRSEEYGRCGSVSAPIWKSMSNFVPIDMCWSIIVMENNVFSIWIKFRSFFPVRAHSQNPEIRLYTSKIAKLYILNDIYWSNIVNLF